MTAMQSRARFLLLIGTHILALGAGWIITEWARKPDQTPVAPGTVLPEAKHRLSASTRPRDGSANQHPAERIIGVTSELIPGESTADAARRLMAEANPETGSHPATGRWGKGFRELLALDSNGVIVWLESATPFEQSTFLALAGDTGLLQGAAANFSDAELGRWQGICKRSGDDSWIRIELARRDGSKGNFQSLQNAMAAKNHEGSAAVNAALAAWPIDRLDEVVGVLRDAADATTIRSLLARLPPKDRLGFANAVLAKSTIIDEESRISLLAHAAWQAVGAPLQDRQDAMLRSKDPFFQTDNLTARIARADVAAVLKDSSLTENNPLYQIVGRVQAGIISVPDAAAIIREQIGEVAKLEPKAFDQAVFSAFARIDPQGAFKLLGNRSRTEMQAAITSIGGENDPASFDASFALLRMAEPDKPGDVQSRFNYWRGKADWGLQLYGDSFVAWAMALPHSLDRDLVLSSIATSVAADYPDWAEQLRAAKSFKEGWRPGMK